MSRDDLLVRGAVLVRGGAGPTPADLARLAALAGGTPATTRGRAASAGPVPAGVTVDGDGAVAVRGPGDPALYVASHGGASAVAATAAAALAAVGAPVTVDAAGVAGLLWRGAPLDAHLPLHHVRGVPPGGRARLHGGDAELVAAAPLGVVPSGDDVRPTTVAEVEARLAEVVAGPSFALLTRGQHASLALLALRKRAGEPEADAFTIHWPGGADGDVAEAGRTARALGARHHVLRPEGFEPVEALERYVATCDLPSLEGFRAALVDDALARAGVPRVATPTGGALLFGLGAPFHGAGRGGLAARWRSRPPRGAVAPFDLPGQRALETAAWRRVPVHAAQAEAALLPVATRDALSTTGPRPPDGTPPTSGPAVLGRVAAAATALGDGELRTPPARAWRPYLDPGVVAAVAALPVAARFRRPGSGGPLRAWVRHAHGWANAVPAEGFAATLARFVAGPWAPVLRATLARERLAADGLWRPDGVAALAALAAGGAAEPTRALVMVALTAAWVRRVRGGPR